MDWESTHTLSLPSLCPKFVSHSQHSPSCCVITQICFLWQGLEVVQKFCKPTGKAPGREQKRQIILIRKSIQYNSASIHSGPCKLEVLLLFWCFRVKNLIISGPGCSEDTIFCHANPNLFACPSLPSTYLEWSGLTYFFLSKAIWYFWKSKILFSNSMLPQHEIRCTSVSDFK